MNGASQRTVWGLTGYQWLVVLAAWLGWGFDVFDALLFNYVSRLCIPDLLGLSPGPETDNTVNLWTGALTSMLLIGWGLGGILFGKITDRLGRTRTLILTMLTYSIGTAACAFAPNVWVLVLFRLVAALGIGGEWAAGAALVAETVPNHKRVLAGALLYTASPMGLFLATFVNDLFTHRIEAIAGNPSLAWRAVFLCGLVPAAVAASLRFFIKEPEMWTKHEAQPRVIELFAPNLRSRTIGGLVIAVTMLLAWWTTNSFMPRVADLLAARDGLDPAGHARYIALGTNAFNLGGLVGTLLCIPIATHVGRRPLFLAYFIFDAIAIAFAFGADIPSTLRLYLMFFVGLTVFGAFGAMPFYLPELFPTRLRGTGAGFCYNVGRFVAAAGPFFVPWVTKLSGMELRQIIAFAAVFPLIGAALLLCGLGHETRDKQLE